LRILILEDDPFIGFDLQAIVEGQGHEVVGVFSSLAEAREHLADRFDFALLDIDVSDGKSFEIAKALLERGVPFAFVSASGSNELPGPLRGARFVPKPFEEATILRTIPHGPVELQ
jgi:DNA-binding response OmpR family regulator